MICDIIGEFISMHLTIIIIILIVLNMLFIWDKYDSYITDEKIDKEIISFFKISNSAKNDDKFPEEMRRFGEEHIKYSRRKLKGEFGGEKEEKRKRYLQRERYLQNILKNSENRKGSIEKNVNTISKILVPLGILVSMLMPILNSTVNLFNGNKAMKNWALAIIFGLSVIIAIPAVIYFFCSIFTSISHYKTEGDRQFYIDVVIPEALEEIREEIQKLEQ